MAIRAVDAQQAGYVTNHRESGKWGDDVLDAGENREIRPRAASDFITISRGQPLATKI
jgi:hypothetical protein